MTLIPALVSLVFQFVDATVTILVAIGGGRGRINRRRQKIWLSRRWKMSGLLMLSGVDGAPRAGRWVVDGRTEGGLYVEWLVGL